jgi:hypothetical protein
MKIFFPRHPTASVALTAALVAGLGCSGGDSNGNSQGDGGGSGGTSFATDVYPIIVAKCVICHGAGSGLVDLSVSATDARSKLVGQTAPAGSPCASVSEPLVMAGNSAMSILYSKVSANPPVCGAPMPFGAAPLSTMDQATIKNWIDQGAKP